MVCVGGVGGARIVGNNRWRKGFWAARRGPLQWRRAVLRLWQWRGRLDNEKISPMTKIKLAA